MTAAREIELKTKEIIEAIKNIDLWKKANRIGEELP